MGHPEPKTIQEPPVTVNVNVTYNGQTKFTDAVDMGEVPEGEYTPPPDASPSGGSSGVAKMSSYYNGASGYTEDLTSTNKELATDSSGFLQIDGTNVPEGNYKIKGTVYLNMSGADAVTIGIYKNTTPTTSWTQLPNTYGTTGNNTDGRFINEITENVATGKHKVEFETVIEGLVTGDIIGMFVKGTTTTASAIIGRTFFYEKTLAVYQKQAINFDI